MKIVLALVLACVLPASAAPIGPPSADALLQRIGEQGGRQVLADVWKDDQAFDHVIDGIESGDPRRVLSLAGQGFDPIFVPAPSSSPGPASRRRMKSGR